MLIWTFILVLVCETRVQLHPVFNGVWSTGMSSVPQLMESCFQLEPFNKLDVASSVRIFFFQPSDIYSEESDDDSDYSEYSEDSESEGKMFPFAFILFKYVVNELSDLFAVYLLVR
jgi:hypothetical protein